MSVTIKPKISKCLTKAIAFDFIEGWLTNIPIATVFDDDPQINAEIIQEMLNIVGIVNSLAAKNFSKLNSEDRHKLNVRFGIEE